MLPFLRQSSFKISSIIPKNKKHKHNIIPHGSQPPTSQHHIQVEQELRQHLPANALAQREKATRGQAQGTTNASSRPDLQLSSLHDEPSNNDHCHPHRHQQQQQQRQPSTVNRCPSSTTATATTTTTTTTAIEPSNQRTINHEPLTIKHQPSTPTKASN